MRRLRDTLKKHFGDTQPKITDIADDDLLHTFPAIIAKEIPEHVDILVQAFDEFMEGGLNYKENK